MVGVCAAEQAKVVKHLLHEQVTGVEEDLIQAVMGPSEDGSADETSPINTTPRYSNSHGLPTDLLSGVGPSMRDRAMWDAKGRAARFRHVLAALSKADSLLTAPSDM